MDLTDSRTARNRGRKFAPGNDDIEIFGASGWRRAAVSRTRGMDSLLDLEAV